jgi:5-methylcytosine-specific restriction endonuclease McrA
MQTIKSQEIQDLLEDKVAAGESLNEIRRGAKKFLRRKDRAGVKPEKRKNIPMKWKLTALQNQGGLCSRCGEPIDISKHTAQLSGDHTIPLALGGTHDSANISAMHKAKCNSSKGANSLLTESKKTGRTILEQIKASGGASVAQSKRSGMTILEQIRAGK